MKVGILSDIHGYPENFLKTLKHFQDCDMILCAGDILYHGPRNPILKGYNPQGLVEEIKNTNLPILTARGNCDADVDLMVLDLPILSDYIIYEANGIRFVMTHGHAVEEDKLWSIGSKYRAQIVITGHTHIRKFEKHLDTYYINPGSISVPKGDGIPSAALYQDGILNFIDIMSGNILETLQID